MVVDTLDDAQAMGFTVIRTWAFNDGDGWNAVQTQPSKLKLSNLLKTSKLKGSNVPAMSCH